MPTVGLVSVAATIGVLVPFRSDIPTTVPALVLVLAVGAAGVVGGPVAAAGVAVAAAACFNLAFIPPFGQLKVDSWEDWVALGVFLAVALVVGPAGGAGGRRPAGGGDAGGRGPRTSTSGCRRPTPSGPASARRWPAWRC